MNVKVDGEFVFTGSNTTIQTVEKDIDFESKIDKIKRLDNELDKI